jgi:TonB family protein
VWPLFDTTNRRLSISFSVVFALHLFFLWSLQRSYIVGREKAKIITDVELLQIEPDKPKPVVAEAPKSVWDTIKQAIPMPSKPSPASAERPSEPLDVMKNLVEKSVREQQQQKLVDRSESIQKMDPMKLEALKQERDTKLAELTRMTGGAQRKVQQLMVQEQTLTERSGSAPAPRSMGMSQPIGLDEVGAKRDTSGNIADILKEQPSKRQAAQSMTASELVEKKQSFKRQLAMLGAQPGTALADSNKAVGKSTAQLGDITGSIKERQKTQEIIALQKLIEQQEPSTPRPIGRGRGPAGLIGGSGAGVSSPALSMTEPKELPATRTAAPPPPAPEVMQKLKKMTEVAEIKKAPVEISGPLEGRKVLSACVPPYPEWAKRKGIEADVALRFFVSPRGTVSPNILVAMTSGYGDLDSLCIDYLKRWSFAPLRANEPQVDQWGIIKIRFRLE